MDTIGIGIENKVNQSAFLTPRSSLPSLLYNQSLRRTDGWASAYMFPMTQVKSLTRTINIAAPAAPAINSSLTSWGAAAAAEAVGEKEAEKQDPLLSLARCLVRHAKVSWGG